MSVESPIAKPKPTHRQAKPKLNIQTEIQNIWRIVNGVSKRLERLYEQVVKK